MTEYNADQLAAIEAAVGNRFAVINGGAGVGKTTTIDGIVDAMRGRPVELCSLAGKAAARIREATGFPAGTIHRMLGYQGEKRGFTRKSLDGVSVVIDEASMVDSHLLAEIVRRHPMSIVLVGDEAQLPPVGRGQPFHDIVRLMPERVSTLSVCYRNNEAVYEAALDIRRGIVPPSELASEHEAYSVLRAAHPQGVQDNILEAVRSGYIDFARDIIICPRNGDGEAEMPCTVKSLNAEIKAMVNPSKEKFARGDRVICIVNHPELDCWNGTTGTVSAIDGGGAMYVALDVPAVINGCAENEVLIEKDSLKDWRLAYALTVHKSQGSQYRRVLLAATMRDTRVLLDRSMLYTAVTRAKSECRIVADGQAVRTAIEAVPSKRTVFQELFREERK